jgi:signal transducing adaptor molecule
LPAQQEPQRFYSPAPTEAPIPQQSYTRPYATSESQQPQGSALPGVAPFHFIPGGLQAAPPPSAADVRRQPSPQQAPASLHNGGPYNAPQGFQGQGRPNSIHTLNSGNPSELATPGLESPADHRNSYPPSQGGQQPPQHHQQQQQQVAGQAPAYDPTIVPAPLSVPAQPHHAPPQIPFSDRDGLPSRQRVPSGEASSNAYVYGQPSGNATGADQAPPPQIADSNAPAQTSAHAPPAAGPIYQAYNPGQGYAPQSQPQQGPPPSNDPGDYYR